jgi:hypothetical protein
MRISRITADRGITIVSTLALVALVAAVCLVRPGATSWLPPCPLHALTGLYCPGCGSTRMLYHLVHGQLGMAFRDNPLSFIALPVVLYGLVRQWLEPASGVFNRIRPAWIVVFTVIVIAFTVVRNIPAQPYCRLAPGGQCRTALVQAQ